MSKEKNKQPHGVLIEDGKQYYRSFDNKKNIGFSFTFGIRNHTDQDIQTRTRAGYSQIITPAPNKAFITSDRRLETRGVWVDIRFKTYDLEKCHRTGVKGSNVVDKAIDAYIRKRVAAEFKSREGMGMDRAGPFELIFSLSLSSLRPNYNNIGYYSETLGLIVDLETTGSIHEFLAEIPETFIQCHGEAEDSQAFEIKHATYRFAYLIDNANDVGEVWCMQNGEPARVKGLKNGLLDSGLYIFSNSESYLPNPYRYIPIDELTDKNLTEIGFALTRKELVEGTRTKEYADMRRKEEGLVKALIEERTQNEKLREEIKRLKEDLREEQLKVVAEKRQSDSLKSDIKSLNRQITELKDVKRNLNNHQKDNTISTLNSIGSLLKLTLDVFKRFPLST